MHTEFEFFEATLFGAKGFFDVALDSTDQPENIFIIPNIESQTILRVLNLKLADAENVLRTSFGQIVVPSTYECVVDEALSYFCFLRKELFEHFAVLEKAWSKTFSSNPIPSEEEFVNLRDLLKWVVAPAGFTRDTIYKAENLSDYTSFHFSEDRIFSFLDALLDEVASCAWRGAASRRSGFGYSGGICLNASVMSTPCRA